MNYNGLFTGRRIGMINPLSGMRRGARRHKLRGKGVFGDIWSGIKKAAIFVPHVLGSLFPGSKAAQYASRGADVVKTVEEGKEKAGLKRHKKGKKRSHKKGKKRSHKK